MTIILKHIKYEKVIFIMRQMEHWISNLSL